MNDDFFSIVGTPTLFPEEQLRQLMREAAPLDPQPYVVMYDSARQVFIFAPFKGLLAQIREETQRFIRAEIAAIFEEPDGGLADDTRLG